MLILSKSHPKIKKIFRYFFLLSLVLSIALSTSYISEPRYWEYSETSGTIRRMEMKRTNPRWSIAKQVVKECCIMLFLAKIIAVMLEFWGIWSYHIGWIMIALTFRKCLMGITVICYDFPLVQKILLQIAQCLGKAILIGTIFFSICQPLEASASVATNTPIVSEPFSSLGACEVLRSTHWEAFLEKKEIIRKRYKISIEDQWILYQKIYENPEIASSKFLEDHASIKITVGQLNRIRKEWKLSKNKGRPDSAEDEKSKNSTILPKAGAHLFALWMEENKRDEEVLTTIYELIKIYKQEHPEEKFRLLYARKKSIEKKWRALMFLPLLKIDRPSQLDYNQHDMASVLGYSYSYLH